jgi:hypothetical protein
VPAEISEGRSGRAGEGQENHEAKLPLEHFASRGERS